MTTAQPEHQCVADRACNEPSRRFHNRREGPTRPYSCWLKGPTSTFTLKTLCYGCLNSVLVNTKITRDRGFGSHWLWSCAGIPISCLLMVLNSVLNALFGAFFVIVKYSRTTVCSSTRKTHRIGNKSFKNSSRTMRRGGHRHTALGEQGNLWIN